MFKQFVETCKSFNRLRTSICRNFSFKLYRQQCVYSNYNLTFSYKLHTSASKQAKIFVDTENKYAYTLLNRPWDKDVKSQTSSHLVSTVEDFNDILRLHYRTSTASNIVLVFKNVKQFCIDHNIPLSDERFNNLVDGLMDQCQDLTDEELYDLLTVIIELPPCESFNSHNFHDVWSCLDDLCIWKMQNWDIQTMFKFGDLWYKLNLGRICDFIFEILDYLPKRAERLTKDELVRAFFYLNICRRKKVNFEFEYALESKINETSADEMAVVSLGYFKTQSSIKLFSIVEAMLKRIAEESKTIHEISLTAILKAIRFTRPGKLSKEMFATLDKLTDEIDRLSNLSALHIALVSTSIMSFHKKSLLKVSQKFIKDINDVSKVRIKDIERLLHSLTMFDFDPKTEPDIFKASFDELHSERRLSEFIKYPRCLSCALNFLSLRNIYSFELMNKILDKDFIEESYGKGAKNLPRELFILDSCIDIECPDYKGNRLPPNLKYKAVKWLTDYTPSYDQYKKISAADQLILDTIDQVNLIVGNKDFVYIDHVLPHFSRADIIICKNKETNKFIKPPGFTNYILGDVMVPFNDGSLKWYAIVVLGWNNTIRETSFPLGIMLMKKRQLEKIGYNTVFVIWNEFMNLTAEQKKQYISSKLN